MSFFGTGEKAIVKWDDTPAVKDDTEVLRTKREETRMAANRVNPGRAANMLGQDTGAANSQRARLLGQSRA